MPVAVLASGGGTNLQALIDACGNPAFPAEIAVVLSNRPKSGAIERARRAGLPVEIVLRRDFPERADFDAETVRRLQRYGVKWVVLAGYMRLVTPVFLRAFPQRVLNIHPSLLPAFPGLRAQQQALDYGVRVAGCTVHFVDEGEDSGPIIAQGVAPVHPKDTIEELQARILTLEHRLYPQCVRWAVEGRIAIVGRQVQVDLPPGEHAMIWDDGLIAG